MFTGIVQEVGMLRDRVAVGDALRLHIAGPGVASRLAVGDSVACEGVCLTVETLQPDGFTACAIPETLAKTTLGRWAVNEAINLETALTANAPMGGHFVLGHVDGVCEVVATKDLGDGGRELTVRLPEEFIPFCVYKGSVTLAGVSLTIAAVEDDRVRVALIPHTLAVTTLGSRKVGDRLNFEVDILAKHVERQLQAREARSKEGAHAV
jgi:riboflavin synthase